MKNALLGAILFLLAGLTGGAQAAERPNENAQPPGGNSRPPAEPPTMDEEMQERMRNTEQELEKQRKAELERIKEFSPEAYKSQKKAMDRQDQISQILSAYSQKTITAEEAERRLTPFIRQQVQQELTSMDEQIKMMEKKLAALRQAKGNPNALVKKRIDQMLGRSMPSPDDMMF